MAAFWQGQGGFEMDITGIAKIHHAKSITTGIFYSILPLVGVHFCAGFV